MWVTAKQVTAQRGYTPGQIKARIQRQHWRQGVEWAWVDGARLFHLDAIDARVDSMARQQQTNQRQAFRVARLR